MVRRARGTLRLVRTIRILCVTEAEGYGKTAYKGANGIVMEKTTVYKN